MAAMNMNQEQFEQATRGEKPVLVDFWAPGAAIAGGSALRMRRLERNTRTASLSARSILTRSRGWRGPRGSRSSQLWCCTGTECSCTVKKQATENNR